MGYDVYLNFDDGDKIIVGWHPYKWQAKRDIKKRPKDIQHRYTIEPVNR